MRDSGVRMIAACRGRSAGRWRGTIALGVATAVLAGCSGSGSFHVNKHPLMVSPVLQSILPKVRNDPVAKPDPDQPGTLVVETRPNGPGQAIRYLPEEHGEAWIFPARDGTGEMRIHVVHHPMNYDDSTDFDIRVEVKTPYTVTIDGQPFVVDEKSANQRIDAAFATMVDRLNEEGPMKLGANAGSENEPVVAAIHQLVPWLTAPPKSPWGA